MKKSLLSPRASGELIARLAKDVSVNQEGVKKVAGVIVEALKKKTLTTENFKNHSLHPQEANEKAIDWLFFIDTINFSFWTSDGIQSYQVAYKGKPYTGYFSVCAATNKALSQGIPLTDPRYYTSLTKQDLKQLLKSDTEAEIPLLDERLANLTETGKILLEKYDSTFVNCIKKCNQSAQKLLDLIVTEFSCFRDEANFEGYRVSFHKRAQLVIADIWALFGGKGLGYFKDIETLTMFADYRVPQPLVHFGALQYSDRLMKKLKEGELMNNGDREEVEIRGCSIWACELVNQEVKSQIASNPDLTGALLNSVMIDHFLWDYRRQHAKKLAKIPFHKVRCIYY